MLPKTIGAGMFTGVLAAVILIAILVLIPLISLMLYVHIQQSGVVEDIKAIHYMFNACLITSFMSIIWFGIKICLYIKNGNGKQQGQKEFLKENTKIFIIYFSMPFVAFIISATIVSFMLVK